MKSHSRKQAQRKAAKSQGVQQQKPRPAKPGPQTPIPKGSFDHIVIILKENHTFDSYFGTYPGVNGTGNLAHAPDPPTGTFRNNHAAWLARATGAVREQYQQADIQSYWSYAQQFAICDNFYTDVASDSTPNHLMLIAATSPIINNPSSGSSPNYNIAKSLPATLQAATLTWRNYGGYAFHYIKQLKQNSWNVTSQQFVTDAAVGKLASVSWVYPPSSQSEHPDNSVTFGMQ